ncbi:MAG TPA: extracellular solute-binding protein, partial [Candidatus Atribacteria bacterium]|nr:extracellular solute-binding protein [Candidatus Atribacteria bacterium]
MAFSTTTIKLWTAPNPNQNLFWKTIIPEWEKTHPDIKIEWSQIPASGSSEEAILNAVASG